MKCIVCKSDAHRVLDTTERDNAIRRRRRCDRCGHRWTTIERDEAEAAGAPVDREAILANIRAIETLVAPRG